jgi:hypothetical protein
MYVATAAERTASLGSVTSEPGATYAASEASTRISMDLRRCAPPPPLRALVLPRAPASLRRASPAAPGAGVEGAARAAWCGCWRAGCWRAGRSAEAPVLRPAGTPAPCP